jgi:O-acetyl-ADP-ribose deacetylase (regulator of RNase III)
MKVDYVIGDATSPVGEGPRIIVHVCNDVGGWGAGFVLAISRRWPEPESAYRGWHRDGEPLAFELGQVQFVEVEQDLWVANLIGQRGLRREGGKPPVRYEAIRAGLAAVREFARQHGASVHMPRIGCGLAGGSWDEVTRIVEDELTTHAIQVAVYDLPPAAGDRS